MKYLRTISTILTILLLSGCTPDKFPKHPDYAIRKPQVKYKASRDNISKMVKQLQGSPYVWAEEGPNYFDCSGLTYYIYGSMGIELPRTAREQAKVGKLISFKDLKYGDLLFFATGKNKHKITHVGIYLGNGWFTHASTSKSKVVYSNIYKSKYFKKRLRVCRRYLPDETTNNQPTWQTTPIATTKSKTTKTNTAQNKAVIINTPIQNIENISKDGIYYVQVGSFKGQPNSTILSAIKEYDLNYRLIQFDINNQHINKLLIGPYKTKAEVEETLQIVKEEIQPNAFIAEIR
jgi:cell wall-associated NlpC family hydrolase